MFLNKHRQQCQVMVRHATCGSIRCVYRDMICDVLWRMQMIAPEQGPLPARVLYSLEDVPDYATPAQRLAAGNPSHPCTHHIPQTPCMLLLAQDCWSETCPASMEAGQCSYRSSALHAGHA